MASSDIPQLLKIVQEQGLGWNETDLVISQALLSSARALVNTLEPPQEKVERLITHYPTLLASARLGVEVKLFDALLEQNGTAKSVDLLAEMVGANPVLLVRIMRHLATEDIVKETGVKEYAPSASTAIFTAQTMTGLVKVIYEMLGPVYSSVVPYFKQNNFSNPSTQSPWQYAMGTDLSAFQWLFQPGNEELAQSMRDGMRLERWSPGGTRLSPWRIFLAILRTQMLFCSSTWVGTKDLPATINNLDAAALSPVEPVAHDFFTQQPVVGAKAYYLKNIIHDWSDEKCRVILSNLKAALTPGYSKILINDAAIPDMGATWKETSAGMVMMLGHAAMERGEAAWRKLVESEGLQITKIWMVRGASEKLIEVELA